MFLAKYCGRALTHFANSANITCAGLGLGLGLGSSLYVVLKVLIYVNKLLEKRGDRWGLRVGVESSCEG